LGNTDRLNPGAFPSIPICGEKSMNQVWVVRCVDFGISNGERTQFEAVFRSEDDAEKVVAHGKQAFVNSQTTHWSATLVNLDDVDDAIQDINDTKEYFYKDPPYVEGEEE